MAFRTSPPKDLPCGENADFFCCSSSCSSARARRCAGDGKPKAAVSRRRSCRRGRSRRARQHRLCAGDTDLRRRHCPEQENGARSAAATTSSPTTGRGGWNYDKLAIRLWDVPAGTSARKIPVPEGPALALDFSPEPLHRGPAPARKFLSGMSPPARKPSEFASTVSLSRFASARTASAAD